MPRPAPQIAPTTPAAHLIITLLMLVTCGGDGSCVKIQNQPGKNADYGDGGANEDGHHFDCLNQRCPLSSLLAERWLVVNATVIPRLKRLLDHARDYSQTVAAVEKRIPSPSPLGGAHSTFCLLPSA